MFNQFLFYSVNSSGEKKLAGIDVLMYEILKASGH